MDLETISKVCREWSEKEKMSSKRQFLLITVVRGEWPRVAGFEQVGKKKVTKTTTHF